MSIMTKIDSTQFIIAGEFMVFAIAVAPMFRDPEDIAEPGRMISFLLMLLALFIAVFFTFWFWQKKIRQHAEETEKRLMAEQDKNTTLENQFKQSSQDRIYELQVTNGALNREIAERIQAEGEIRALQKRQTLILDSAGEGILGLDKRGRVMFMNKAASLMLGWEQEELSGLTHHRRIHHTLPDGTEHKEEDCPIYQAYKDGKVHYKTGDVFWCKNGSSFPVEYVSTPIEDQGMLTGAVVVFRDLNTYK
jgi:PAS domain S-box-containing protein